MNLMAFGIVRDGGPAWPGRIEYAPGRPVALVAAQGLAFACASLPSREAATQENVRQFARVVDALHRRSAVLPFRYGCWSNSEGEFEGLLRHRHRSFLKALDEVDGCEEMSLQVLTSKVLTRLVERPREPTHEPATAGGTPGTAFLGRLQSHYSGRDAARTRSDEAFERFRHALQGFFVRCEDAPKPVPGIPGLDSLAVLIRRDQLAAFRESFDLLRSRFGGDRLRVTGPWPPYHFADAQLEDSGP